MNMTLPRSQLVGLLALVAACDTRADENYPGDSLLHLEGRVILEDHDGQGLVPALAFATKRGMVIVDVDVQGSFPNNFRIEVYSPPPEAARLRARDDLDVPRGVQLAIGYVAAIPKDHPKELLNAHYFFTDSAEFALRGGLLIGKLFQRAPEALDVRRRPSLGADRPLVGRLNDAWTVQRERAQRLGDPGGHPKRRRRRRWPRRAP